MPDVFDKLCMEYGFSKMFEIKKAVEYVYEHYEDFIDMSKDWGRLNDLKEAYDHIQHFKLFEDIYNMGYNNGIKMTLETNENLEYIKSTIITNCPER